MLRITQGESESKGIELIIEHLPFAMLSTWFIDQASTSGEDIEKKPSLFSHYVDIKRHNREMKNDMYPQVVGEMTQTKLLTTLDYQHGTFNLDLLESKVPKTLSQIDYKETQIKFKLGNIQPNDIIDLHQ